MKTLTNIATYPAGLPLSPDDIVEFHAARVLLLLFLTGTKGAINGLTKFAKLDFFVRYPDFFDVARRAVNLADTQPGEQRLTARRNVESAMIRHHYGPWDKRYYHVLAYLEARRLVEIRKDGRLYYITLTTTGRHLAKRLSTLNSFRSLVAHMREVKKIFGARSGSSLKKLIYKIFEAEVACQPLGSEIRQ